MPLLLLQAYAAARMAESVLLGLQGTITTECAFVESDVVPGVDFFAHKVQYEAGSIVLKYVLHVRDQHACIDARLCMLAHRHATALVF